MLCLVFFTFKLCCCVFESTSDDWVCCFSCLMLCGVFGDVCNLDLLPLNGELGVPGFPDCKQPLLSNDTCANQYALDCRQDTTSTTRQVNIACVGDSITAGANAQERIHTYPAQLQQMLQESDSSVRYNVKNLGASGATLMSSGNSPYIKRQQYKGLLSGHWDVVIVMLGRMTPKTSPVEGPITGLISALVKM